MTDTELIQEFCSVKSGPNGVTLFVCVITWPTSHTLNSTWEVAATLPVGTGEDKIAATLRDLLTNLQYFGWCGSCEQRQPTGWMHNSQICQSCAEKSLGVAY